jgi:hypothetical protein
MVLAMKAAALVFTLASLVPAAALAQPTADVPESCKSVATPPASATIPMPGLIAKVSLAYCGARERFAALKLAPDDASMKLLMDAAKPSFDLLDAVIQANDPVASETAKRLRSALLVGMAVRMRLTIPSITPDTVGPQLAALMKAHDDLEPKIKPWLDMAAKQ